MPDYPFNFVNSSVSGNALTDPFITHFEIRDPTPQDVNFPIQKRWLNKTVDSEWILEGFSSSGGVVTAVWSKIAGGSLITETLTGNSGGPVGPDVSNNINVVGDGTSITIAGNPATHTLTASAGGTVATSYVEDSGTAIPVAGVLNVKGGTGITTSGAGNTVTITATTSTPLQFTEDTGVAIPVADNLNIFGGTGITTSGAGDTVTIKAAASVATTYQEDTGTATAVANLLKILGGVGIHTTGSGNTITITNTGSGSGGGGILNRQIFTSNGTYTPTSGMITAFIQILGGGGAGGGCGATGALEMSTSSGGGGAEYAEGLFSSGMIGASQAITIGAGGTGNNGAAGGNGGNSSVGALISAFGGQGGAISFVGTGDEAAPSALGGTGGAGGDVRTPGDASYQSFTKPAPSTGIVYPTNGADTQFGAGGIYGFETTGSPGLGFGSGGGGTGNAPNQSAQTGGAGAPGIVIITEYGSLTGQIIQQVRTALTGTVNTNNPITTTGSIPSNTDGDALLSLAITPKSASSVLVFEFSTYYTLSNTTQIGSFALYNGAAASAFYAIAGAGVSATYSSICFVTNLASPGTSPVTFHLRYGPSNNTATMYINSNGGTQSYGGVEQAVWTITEYSS